MWPVEELLLTVPPECNPSPGVPWVRCLGLVSAEEMLRIYHRVDALVFLSTDESYGFPLVEAMSVGIPVICPDLPYAHALCGDGAIYFNPVSLESLQSAVCQLHSRLASGWWPDWSAQLAPIPRDWDAVATAMLEVVRGI
jgi:glycosyltransferase involved in cell wall biosynthesis